jgi:hypothetical protein
MIESAIVGRKTPGDGKLEVSPALATMLGGGAWPVTVHIAGRAVPGSVQIMECTCAKAGMSGKHAHHFVQCDAFRDLPPGTALELTAESKLLAVAW